MCVGQCQITFKETQFIGFFVVHIPKWLLEDSVDFWYWNIETKVLQKSQNGAPISLCLKTHPTTDLFTKKNLATSPTDQLSSLATLW